MITLGIIFLIFLIGYILLKRRDLIRLNLRIRRLNYIQLVVVFVILIFIINFIDKKLAYEISNRYPQGLLAAYPILNGILTNFFKIVTHLGEPDFIAIGALPVFLYSRYKKNKNLETIILKLIVIMVFASLISTVLKVFVMRSRPYQGWNNLGFYFILDSLQNRIPFNGNYMSFPSGHTLVASATYFFLALINKKKYIKIFWVILAILVAISRVYLSYHWLSDVFISLIIGLFLAKKYKETFIEKEIK